MSDQNQDQQKQQDAGKEAKKFEANWRKLVALMNGESIFRANKLGTEDLTIALTELTGEEKKALIAEFKDKARGLIKSKTEFDKFTKEQQKKMDQAILEKKKELNKEMQSIFGIIDKIENIERTYYEALRDMSRNPEPQQPEDHGIEGGDTGADGGQSAD